MKIHTTDLTKEFAKKVQEEFPDIEQEDIETACNNIFHFIRSHIKNRRELPIVRVKRLGKFYVSPGRILRLLEINDNRLKHKAILEETHKQAKEELLFMYDQLKNHGYNSNKEIVFIDEEDTTASGEQKSA